MRVTQQPACILHARAWRETSLLLEVFSRDFGRVGLVARGVRGAHARLPRSLLEPLQALCLDWSGRGELQTLTAVEPDGSPSRLRGDHLLAAMYVNELLVRLTARNDPHPVLFQRYVALLEEMADTSSMAWSLRCFERDLLATLGYAPRLETDAVTGAPINPMLEYEYLPEQGAVPVDARSGGLRIRGSALLALATGEPPGVHDMAALRRLMRALLGVHLGERSLQSWRVLAGPARRG